MNHTENANLENKENAIPTSLPIFWPMAAAEAMLCDAGAERTERNLRFLAEEETLHQVPAIPNKTLLDLSTDGHIGLFMSSRRLKNALPEIAGWTAAIR